MTFIMYHGVFVPFSLKYVKKSFTLYDLQNQLEYSGHIHVNQKLYLSIVLF